MSPIPLTDLPNKTPSQTKMVPSDISSILTKITDDLASLSSKVESFGNPHSSILPKKPAYASILKSNLSVPSTYNNNQYSKPTATHPTLSAVIKHLLYPERNIKFIKSLFN